MQLGRLIDELYVPSLGDLAPSTRVGYLSVIEQHIRPRWGDVDTDEITPWAVESWCSTMSAGTAHSVCGELKRILNRAEGWGVCKSPLKGATIRLPRKHTQTPDVLTAKQARELLRGFWDHELEAWLIVSLMLGLRRGEACAITWDRIDLRSGAVHVSSSLQVVEGAVVEVPVKTDKSNRVVYLPRTAVLRLRDIKGTGRLIGGMSPDAVARHYRAYCHKHELPFVPPTNLRHSFATISLQAGVPPTTIATILGHTSLAMVYEHYLVPTRKVYRDAANALESALLE